MPTTTKPETKIVKIEGNDVLMQKCQGTAPGCKGWFVKTKKNRNSCGPRCAMSLCKSWQNRNNKDPKKSAKNK